MTAIGVLIWLAFGALIWASFRQIRLQSVPEAAVGEGCASVSIVVPARNEAARIGTLVASVRAQDHPDFEVIVVDDRSTDGTGDAVMTASANDPRFRILRAGPRPPGWQGKLHAVRTGADEARGEWLLLLDADQRLASPRLLRSLIAEFERRGVAAIALVARNVGERWWQRWWLHPIINNPVVWGVMLLFQRARPDAAWLIGSMGMRRTTYTSLGARAGLRCAAGAYEDWGWARTLSERGQRTAMVIVPGFEDATNFESFPEFLQGTSRWIAGLFTYRKGGWFAAGAIAAALLVMLGATASVLAGALAGRVPAFGMLSMAAILPTLGIAYCRWTGEPLRVAWGFPVAALLTLVTIGGAVWARCTNRVVWRGETVRIVSPFPEEESESLGSAERDPASD